MVLSEQMKKEPSPVTSSENTGRPSPGQLEEIHNNLAAHVSFSLLCRTRQICYFGGLKLKLDSKCKCGVLISLAVVFHHD